MCIGVVWYSRCHGGGVGKANGIARVRDEEVAEVDLVAGCGALEGRLDVHCGGHGDGGAWWCAGEGVRGREVLV
jgi:hypothetical protein